MNILRAITFTGIIAIAIAMIYSCAMPVRTGYDRRVGGYKPAARVTDEKSNPAKETPIKTATSETIPDSIQASATPNANRSTARNVKAAATQKSKTVQPKSKGTLENYASAWLGAKYVYGAASKKQTDCSGFVMQVYKGFYDIALDHSASKMYKDPRGSKVGRSSLKEGDLVFFGSFWSIDHVGIYLKGDRFIHASTSKGVIISPMSDKYWSHKYQGGRRFK